MAKKTTRRAKSEAPVSAREALAWLKRRGTKKGLADMARYGITAEKAFGVSVGDTKKYAREIGRDHEIALALWASGWYEARLLAAFVDEPERVTPRQMDQWSSDFDSWAVVDTVCFHLFDRTAHAWKKAEAWAKARKEFRKRAAFALLWSLSVHDKDATDAAFKRGLALIEGAADDDRDPVKKGIDMALRAIGKRSAKLNAAAVRTATRLSTSEAAAPRWIGKHALRELTSAAVRKRLGLA